MLNNKNYYPTEKFLIRKMLSDVDLKYINTILEPSCGSGNIVSYITEELKNYRYNNAQPDIDCIEIDNNLQSILKGKGFRVIHDDFLTFQTYKSYSLIIGNPPFDNGDKHLLKAIELAEKQHNSCNIIFLLNAETIRNPYSNNRKTLIKKLDELNANIEYIPDAFITAERKTSVEVALIKIHIQKETKLNDSFIYNELQQKEKLHNSEPHNSDGNLIHGDFLTGLVEQYNFEVEAGLKLINEYNSLSKLMLCSFKKDNPYNNSILELKLYHNDNDSNLENGYIKQVRSKYWEALFKSDQFIGACTNNLRKKYFDKIGELKNYDFSLFNIYSIKIELNKEMIKGVEETIVALFDELSYQYSYSGDYSKNIHYFNGWKNNKSWKINDRKVIIPLNCYNWYDKNRVDLDYKVKEKLSDIEKALNYLSDGSTPEIDLNNAIENANKNQISKKIETKYFYIDIYKKGTTHIIFKYPELIQKLNIYGAKNKNFIFSDYGKKSYKDMTKEEKEVVNNFHQGKGEESYKKIYENKNYYITETSSLLMLT